MAAASVSYGEKNLLKESIEFHGSMNIYVVLKKKKTWEPCFARLSNKCLIFQMNC